MTISVFIWPSMFQGGTGCGRVHCPNSKAALQSIETQFAQLPSSAGSLFAGGTELE